MGMFIVGQHYWSHRSLEKPPSWYRIPKEQTPREVKEAVEDWAWQMFRGQHLKGLPTDRKLMHLQSWLDVWWDTEYYKLAWIQVENYLGALKRGGFIRYDQPEDVEGYKVGNHFWVVTK